MEYCIPVSLANKIGGAKLALAKWWGDLFWVKSRKTKHISPANTAIPVATPTNAEKSDVSKTRSAKLKWVNRIIVALVMIYLKLHAFSQNQLFFPLCRTGTWVLFIIKVYFKYKF